jgi:hypothetical protein
LRALAAAVESFKRDKSAAVRVSGHLQIINERLAFGTGIWPENAMSAGNDSCCERCYISEF